MARKKPELMASDNIDENSSSGNDETIKAKRKEFRQMKARYIELRETLKAASAERKALEERLAPLAAELGMSFKGVKNSPPAVS